MEVDRDKERHEKEVKRRQRQDELIHPGLRRDAATPYHPEPGGVGKPTPTQEEQDAHALGERPKFHEPTVSTRPAPTPPDPNAPIIDAGLPEPPPESDAQRRKAMEAEAPGNYKTRVAQPDKKRKED
jgi:hypothetical protein